MRDFLIARLTPLGADGVDAMLTDGAFVDATGRPLTGAEAYTPHTFIWFHRALREEPPVPFELEIRYADERIVVVDKPHFLSTIPRGRHVTESVVVRARRQLGLPELGPAHRLDRLTAGLVLLTTESRWRAPYQRMFEDRLVTKRYLALAGHDPRLALPRTVRSHIVKRRGSLQAIEVPDAEPNAETRVELDAVLDGCARYRLTPRTGRTHQLRLHLNSLGVPILGDPLYPHVLDTNVDDFATPLQLLAAELEFTDPVDGSRRHFVSGRDLRQCR
ncbi:pseudouridylate synthase [Naumannella sp. ID2617S]|uniref:RNA pseudouridylate synthase n=1 Tax=Enemella dayhoffiae TaxID=2016507 RepID=A0A255GRJ8_9ACTN|nr:pseudouridine synthase [Enemella dayhoffiae]NNG18061.1 pseudouridylate synthase [Naumannella sp. ID2617S]OYO18435.1 pseudouridylate synthase [Enemella dayhoffiae]